MERKQGFFSTMIRGISPARSRVPAEKGIFQRRNSTAPLPLTRSGSFRRVETLSPLMEGPDADEEEDHYSRMEGTWGDWMKGHLCLAPPDSKRSDLRLLLGVMGAPLAPLHVNNGDPLPHLSIKDTPIESSSAQYILQQYTAATGGQRVQTSIQNSYAMGKIKTISYEIETATKVIKARQSSKTLESGGFVLWQMNPDMWYVELSLSGNKIHAGCNGKLVWRHTPWLGAHAAKGPVRPLRRALQGLDPRTTAAMFSAARCIGEKVINGEDCFVLKLCTDPATLKARSEGPAEIIRHVLFGYFSQKSGLLVLLEDSHLTRIQNNGGDTVYWETTINSYLEDYRSVEGVIISHSGRSIATLFRFGETAMSHTKTRMEEAWSIEEVAFNVQGLSVDCFIPPAELRFGSFEKPSDDDDVSRILWNMKI